MIKYENDCCGCAVPGYPCLGDACRLRHAPHIYCDECGEELYDGEEEYNLDQEYHLCDNCRPKPEDEICECCVHSYHENGMFFCKKSDEKDCPFYQIDYVSKCVYYEEEEEL